MASLKTTDRSRPYFSELSPSNSQSNVDGLATLQEPQTSSAALHDTGDIYEPNGEPQTTLIEQMPIVGVAAATIQVSFAHPILARSRVAVAVVTLNVRRLSEKLRDTKCVAWATTRKR